MLVILVKEAIFSENQNFKKVYEIVTWPEALQGCHKFGKSLLGEIVEALKSNAEVKSVNEVVVHHPCSHGSNKTIRVHLNDGNYHK